MTKTTMSTDLLQSLKIFSKLAFKIVSKYLKATRNCTVKHNLWNHLKITTSQPSKLRFFFRGHLTIYELFGINFKCQDIQPKQYLLNVTDFLSVHLHPNNFVINVSCERYFPINFWWSKLALQFTERNMNHTTTREITTIFLLYHL